MQFDRPGGACHRIGKFGAGADVIDRQLLAADDPAGLADAGKAVGANARIAEALGKLLAQEGHRAVGLILAVDCL